MIRSFPRVVIAAVSLTTVGFLAGCSQKSYWVDAYSVPIRIRAGDDKPIAGVVARAFSTDEIERAVTGRDGAIASSPETLDLLEMNELEPRPLGDDGTIVLSVMRRGVDRHPPQRQAIHERRQEKVVLGVCYVDGSKKAFVFDIPPPGPDAEIIADLRSPQGDPSDAAPPP